VLRRTNSCDIAGCLSEGWTTAHTQGQVTRSPSSCSVLTRVGLFTASSTDPTRRRFGDLSGGHQTGQVDLAAPSAFQVSRWRGGRYAWG